MSKSTSLNTRSRNFVFTWNNYDQASFDILEKLDCRYIVYGKETAPSTGTIHLQGFVCFDNARTLRSLIKLLVGCGYVDVARGSPKQASDYCKKIDDFVERGNLPMSQQEKAVKGQEYWQKQKELAQHGKFDEIDPKLFITHYGSLNRIKNDFDIKHKVFEETDEKMLWYYGDTGTGKSYTARKNNPGAYLKPLNEWWDGYNDEQVVIIDDFDKRDASLIRHLKIWSDRYPFIDEVKNSSKKLRPRLLIVTSNYHPSEIWSEKSDLDPILRRFKVVKFVNSSFSVQQSQQPDCEEIPPL